MKNLRRMGWLGLCAGALSMFVVAACSSGGSSGVDASGSGGSSHAGAGGGGGTARGGTGGLGGQGGGGAVGGAAAGGQSGSQGGGGTAGGGGSGGPTGCNVVYDCPAGQTCLSHKGTDFTCVPSGPEKVGDPCDVRADAGIACGDQLICAQTTSAGAFCIQLCDTSHLCPAGKTCTPTVSEADQPLSVCL
jgi:hypothetical protein